MKTFLLTSSLLLNLALGYVVFGPEARVSSPPPSEQPIPATNTATSTAQAASTIQQPLDPPQATVSVSSSPAFPCPPSPLAPQLQSASSSFAAPPASPDPNERTTLGERQVVDFQAPGNSISFRGMRVALAETYQPRGAGSRSMGVDVSPDPHATTNATADSAPAASAPSIDSPIIATTPGNELRAASHNPEDSRAASAATAGTGVATPVAPALVDHEIQSDGFTREEELFRLKWGWAAFDAARSEARREAGRTSAN